VTLPDDGDAARADRIEGVLLGAACGDALGVPYEFGRPPAGEPLMRGGGLGPYAPGEWSDDTQMSVCIARVSATGADLTSPLALDDIAAGFEQWYAGGASDVGNQTRSVLGAVVAGSPTRPAQDARLASYALHAQTGHTAGNGSLMRTAPVALAFLDDPVALADRARAISGLTHADPLTGDACVLWCHAIRLAVLDGAVPDLGDLVRELPAERRDSWSGWIAAADTGLPADFAPNGFVVTALQAAWSAIRHPWADDSPTVGSLVAAVHAGNDTDTVAAIAGALLGAAHGAASVPEQWLADVHGWPGLRADDLRDLARRVARR
jgi:ADP-ribosylglycohydrolase